MQVVVLDTNALLLPVRDGTDLEAELLGLVGAHELVVPSCVVTELEQLAEGGGADGRAARAALGLVLRYRVETTDLPGDDGVLAVARALGGWVVTNDRKLHGECVRGGIRVISSRGAGRLAFRL